MKKYFSSGLVTLLPIVLTLMIVNFLINVLTRPFLTLTSHVLEQLSFFQHPFFLFPHSLFITFSSKLFILVLLSAFIVLMGLLGKMFLIETFLRIGNLLLYKLPFFNKIYKTCQDVVQSLFSSSSQKFTQVVFAPFPNPQSLSMGLVSNAGIELKNREDASEKLVSVFVPGTPNPSVGYLLMFKREQLFFLDMKVEEAMKFIVSCGIVMPDFEIIQPLEAYEKHPSTKDYILSSERELLENPTDLCQSTRSI